MERMIAASDGQVGLDVDGVREVHIELVAGEVSVGGTTSPSWLEVTCLVGNPVSVQLADGVLIVRQGPGLSKFDRASVTLTVPPDTPLRVRTISAGVLIAGLAADCRARTVSGEVTGSFLGGEVNLSTLSGDIAVEGVAGRLRATTVSGSITLTAASPQQLAAKALSGDIAVDLDPRPGGSYECQTVSGGTSVRLAPDAGVDVEAATLSGRVLSDTEERSSGWPRRRSWQLGDGGSALRVRTLSGDIVVLRQKEPVTV